MSDSVIDNLRASKPRLAHYDERLWDAMLHAQHVQVRVMQLADELRRLATAHPHSRKRMIDEGFEFVDV